MGVNGRLNLGQIGVQKSKNLIGRDYWFRAVARLAALLAARSSERSVMVVSSSPRVSWQRLGQKSAMHIQKSEIATSV